MGFDDHVVALLCQITYILYFVLAISLALVVS